MSRQKNKLDTALFALLKDVLAIEKRCMHAFSAFISIEKRCNMWYLLISQVYRVAGSPSIFALSTVEYNSSDKWARKNVVFFVTFCKAGIA